MTDATGPLDSDVAVGMLQRAQMLTEQGDWELAGATFARVVGNGDPALHTAALLGLAECRYRIDDDEGALQAWITATQAPENPMTWRAWKALAAARVRSDDLPGAARAYREAERRAPSSELPEINSRIGWLSKELGDERASKRAFGRSRTGIAPQPRLTFAIIGITVAISVVTLFLDATGDLERLLWLDKGSVFFLNEYWRLFSVVLVHGSILHLGFNMYALFIIGPIVESLYRPARYLMIYLLCAAAGSAASYMTSPNPAVGASGAVFGLFGALLVADRVHKPALTRGARNLTMQIGVLIAINLFIGFAVPQIDNAAHIGGLLAGAWLGFILVPEGATLGSFWSRPARAGSGPNSPDLPTAGADRTRVLRIGGVLALVGVIVAMVAVGPVTYDPRIFLLFGG